MASAAAAVAVAMGTAATKMTVIAAERARAAAMAAVNAMVMAAAMAVSTAAAKAVLKWLPSSSEAAEAVRQCRSMGGGNGVFAVAMTSSGHPCPQLWQQAMAMTAMGKASKVARVRARMGHC